MLDLPRVSLGLESLSLSLALALRAVNLQRQAEAVCNGKFGGRCPHENDRNHENDATDEDNSDSHKVAQTRGLSAGFADIKEWFFQKRV